MSEERKKILIVDDEAAIVELLKTRLIDSGYDVIEASDGYEGLEKIKQFSPDLVVLDVLMPKMTGYEVVNALKSMNQVKKTAIVVISAKHSMSQFFDSWDIAAFIPKPFDSKTLVNTIDNILLKKQVQQNAAAATAPRRDSKVLLVSSVQEFIFTRIKDYFEARNCKVEKALDEKDLLKEARKILPDLIVAEFFEDSTVLNAAKIYKDLKNNEQLRHIPCVVYTSPSLSIDAQKEIPFESVLVYSSAQELCGKIDSCLAKTSASRVTTR